MVEPPGRHPEDASRRDDVLVHQLGHPGPQHLHRHVLALVDRPVHLPEGGRRDRDRVKVLEQLGVGMPVVLEDDPLHLGERHRRHPVGEGGEGGGVRAGEEIVPPREDLAHLHEGGAEAAQRRDDPLGAAGVEGGGARHRTPEVEPAALVPDQAQGEREQLAQDGESSHGLATGTRRPRAGCCVSPGTAG